MADTSHALLFDALTRAATAPAGLPLFTSKAAPGLFANSAAGKSAAQRSKADGLLSVVRTEARGKSAQEVCGITPTGLEFLLHHADPRPVLKAFVAVLEKTNDELSRNRHEVEALRDAAVQVLERIAREPQPGSVAHRNGVQREHAAADAIVAELGEWQATGVLGDCPLPELFRRLHPRCSLTIGQFHDELRLLHQAQQIYLHPWTGPLYELPEPALALLVGHEIAYYASLRSATV